MLVRNIMTSTIELLELAGHSTQHELVQILQPFQVAVYISPAPWAPISLSTLPGRAFERRCCKDQMTYRPRNSTCTAKCCLGRDEDIWHILQDKPDFRDIPPHSIGQLISIDTFSYDSATHESLIRCSFRHTLTLSSAKRGKCSKISSGSAPSQNLSLQGIATNTL